MSLKRKEFLDNLRAFGHLTLKGLLVQQVKLKAGRYRVRHGGWSGLVGDGM